MTKKRDEAPGMKSAVELAMERLRAKEGDVVPLSSGQKAEIAGIEAETRAKVAQEEILARDRLRAAAASGDPEALRTVQEQTASEIARLRERGESRKRAVRGGGA